METTTYTNLRGQLLNQYSNLEVTTPISGQYVLSHSGHSIDLKPIVTLQSKLPHLSPPNIDRMKEQTGQKIKALKEKG